MMPQRVAQVGVYLRFNRPSFRLIADIEQPNRPKVLRFLGAPRYSTPHHDAAALDAYARLYSLTLFYAEGVTQQSPGLAAGGGLPWVTNPRKTNPERVPQLKGEFCTFPSGSLREASPKTRRAFADSGQSRCARKFML